MKILRELHNQWRLTPLINDFLNHGLFYNPDGTSHSFALGTMAGEVASDINVGLAMPVAIPAMVPNAARSALVNGLRH